MRLHSVRRSDSDEIESCFYDLSRSFSESDTRRRTRCVVVDYADVVVETVESLSQRDYLTCDYAGLVFFASRVQCPPGNSRLCAALQMLGLRRARRNPALLS